MMVKYQIIALFILSHSYFDCAFAQNIPNPAPEHMRAVEKLLIEAGCKGEKYDEYEFRWVQTGVGYLLRRGACIPTTYDRNLAPTIGQTVVYITIEMQRIRTVYHYQNMVDIELQCTMRWVGPLISTNFFYKR